MSTAEDPTPPEDDLEPRTEAEEQILDAVEDLLFPDPPASPADEADAPPPG